MKRVLPIICAVVASLAATSLVAAAGPIFYNGGPTPDPQALSRCAGEQDVSMFVNGDPYPAASPSSTSVDRDTRPIMMNGGPTPLPTSTSAASDPRWCGGAYRPDAGTNFSGS
jgi:hypothetical protein